MARGRQKQLDRMEKMEALDQKEIRLYFHFTSLTNAGHLIVKQLSVGYQYPAISRPSYSGVLWTGFVMGEYRADAY